MIVKDVAPTGPIEALRHWLKKWRCGQGFHDPCPNGRQISPDSYKSVCTACGEPMLRVGDEWLTGWIPPENSSAPALAEPAYRTRRTPDADPAYRTLLSYAGRAKPAPTALDRLVEARRAGARQSLS